MTTNRTRRARVDYPEGDSAGERQWVERGGSLERRRERKSGLSRGDAAEGFARQQEKGGRWGNPGRWWREKVTCGEEWFAGRDGWDVVVERMG